MENNNQPLAGQQEARTQKRSFLQNEVVLQVRHILALICHWVYKLRSVLLAIPVLIVAILLARENAARLPELVGINLQSSGEYAMMIERDVAVYCPLLVTAVSLLLSVCSRRVFYPWLISVFSLVIPILIWFTNVFPA